MPISLTDDNITKSIYEWWSINYTRSPIDFKNGDNFNEDDHQSFVEFMLDDIVDDVVRTGEVRRVKLHVTVRCYGKSGSNIFASLGDSSEVSTLLRQATIPCKDYTDPDTTYADRTTVGWIRFYEPKSLNEGDLQGDLPQDIRTVSVDGSGEQTA